MKNHWHQVTDSNNCLWLTLDRQDTATNTINVEVLEQLSQLLDEIKNHAKLRAVIIASGKTNGFIYGADIKLFTQVEDRDAIINLLNQGQSVFNQLAALQIPTIAMINGMCIGGGLELALACRYRVAVDSSQLGLPEVKLGIFPGWGGTVRLPRLIGGMQAMDLILNGRLVSAKQALKLGMIDAAVPERQLKRAAEMYATGQFAIHQPTLFQKLTNSKPLRQLLGGVIRRKLRQKVQQTYYPHVYAALDKWVKYGVEDQGFAEEVSVNADLISNYSTFKNLVRVFFLQERLKGLGKGIEFKAQHVHVIGAGVMGRAIAAWCALRGIHVTVQDREPNLLGPAIKEAAQLFKKKLKDPLLIQAAMDRLQPDPAGHGAANADVIIEAIYENLQAKQDLFKHLEQVAKPTAILATNTSSIPLDEINQVLKHPERLVGIHYFNPVSQMQLVEIVHGQKTKKEIVQQAIAFVRQIDRLPLPVKSSPGFLVNRVLMPYIIEALQLLHEKVPAALIDNAALNFGMPMGPIELADTVGLDVLLSVGKHLAHYFHGEIPHELVKLVEAGHLGRKTGRGFYVYKNDKPVKEKIGNETLAWRDIANRLILRMVNEAAACLREQVVEDADLLDAGMIFGTGFAPFRGGPLHYAQSFDQGQLNKLYIQLQEQYGDRFTPDTQWSKLLFLA